MFTAATRDRAPHPRDARRALATLANEPREHRVQLGRDARDGRLAVLVAVAVAFVVGVGVVVAFVVGVAVLVAVAVAVESCGTAPIAIQAARSSAVTSWMAKLAPDAARFAADVHGATTTLDTHVEVTKAGLALASKARAARSRPSPFGRPLVVFASLLVLFLAVYNFVTPSEPSRGARRGADVGASPAWLDVAHDGGSTPSHPGFATRCTFVRGRDAPSAPSEEVHGGALTIDGERDAGTRITSRRFGRRSYGQGTGPRQLRARGGSRSRARSTPFRRVRQGWSSIPVGRRPTVVDVASSITPRFRVAVSRRLGSMSRAPGPMGRAPGPTRSGTDSNESPTDTQ